MRRYGRFTKLNLRITAKSGQRIKHCRPQNEWPQIPSGETLRGKNRFIIKAHRKDAGIPQNTVTNAPAIRKVLQRMAVSPSLKMMRPNANNKAPDMPPINTKIKPGIIAIRNCLVSGVIDLAMTMEI